MDLRVSAYRQVLLTNIASSVFGFAMFAMSLVLPQLLRLPEAAGYGMERSMLVVGLVMAPSGPVMMAMAPVTFPSQTGFRVIMGAGAGAALLALAIAAFLPSRRPEATTTDSQQAGTTASATAATSS